MSGDGSVEETPGFAHAGAMVAVAVCEKYVSWMDLPDIHNRVPYDPDVAAGVHKSRIAAALIVDEIGKIRVETPDLEL